MINNPREAQRHRELVSLLQKEQKEMENQSKLLKTSQKLWELKWKIEAKIFRIWNELTRTDRI